MPVEIGSRIGAYEIVALVGEGGMGRVFRARDARLDRDAALKVLPDLFVADPERLARFEREARTLAALNHPHIAQIYGIEQAAGVSALVMEFVDGEDLAARIARGPIAVDEALPIARQIAEAIEAAHEQGIVHRDLKPANIKLRRDGTVKVLDFGLAKALDDGAPIGGDRTGMTSPTITSPAMTMRGMILGTAAYMSPEQARGRPAEKRSDVWAYGCVLYEMLTGTRAFDGEEVSDTLAAVLRAEPDWSRLPVDTPTAIRKLLRGCLQKERRDRVPDIGVARLEIRDALAAPVAEPSVSSIAASKRVAPIPIVAAIAAAASIGTGLLVWRSMTTPIRTPQPVQRLSMLTPATAPYIGDVSGDFAISPDGTRVVYPAAGQGGRPALFIRRIDQVDSQPLVVPTTAGAIDPFFSPDGEWVAFFQVQMGAFWLGARGTLSKVAVRGGPPIELCEANNPFGGSWSPDGKSIVIATADIPGRTGGAVIYRVPAAGGKPERLIPPRADDLLLQTWPDILPRGKGILYTARSQLGQRDDSRIVVLTDDGQRKTVLEHGSHARYVATGHLVYLLGTTLMAVAFDLDRLEVRGDPVPLVDAVGTTPLGNASFAFSPAGILMYSTLAAGAADPPRALVWVDRNGHEQTFATPHDYYYPRLSPDGSRIAIDIREGAASSADIWSWDIARSTLTRLTTDGGGYPLWTPDGKRIVFGRIGGDRPGGVYWQAADGTGEAECVIERTQAMATYSFTPDGAKFVVRESYPQTSDDVMLVTLPSRSGGRVSTATIEPLIHSTFVENNAEISPDGHWIAYQSNESGAYEVYVRPFPNTQASRTLISTGGGTRPAWSRDGRELFYMMGANPDPIRLMRVPTQIGPSFSAGTPQLLFQGSYFASASPAARGRTYDVTADGKRFVMVKDSKPATANEATPFTVVLNWFDELRRIAPTAK